MKLKSMKIINAHWQMLIVLSAMVSGGETFAAVLHSDFDPGGTYNGGTEGWFNYASLPEFTTATPAGGATSWLAVQPNQYYGNVTSQNWAVPDVTIPVWNSSSNLEFDVIVDSSWYPNNSTQPIAVEFQVDGGVEGLVNQYANPNIDTSLKDTPQHVSIPLASMQPFDATATIWNLSINFSPGYAYEWDASNPNVQAYEPHFYLDNITWTTQVPEPASVGLLALSCCLFCLRRSESRH